MRASAFEVRRQLLLHQLIVGCALLTYLFDGEDVVWRYVKNAGSGARLWERSLFAAATLLFGISAWICTVARTYAGREGATTAAVAGRLAFLRRLRYFGDFLYALALGSLLPLSGFFILIVGEAIRLFRLSRQTEPFIEERSAAGYRTLNGPAPNTPQPGWDDAFRAEAIKWGLFLTMIVFTWTLKDRIAEVLIAATVLLWGALNLRGRRSSRERDIIPHQP